MEIRVYLHRTKKKEFQVADCFSVFVDFIDTPPILCYNGIRFREHSIPEAQHSEWNTISCAGVSLV